MFNIDTNFLPGNDFNKYVNNKWLESNPIPDDYNRWGSFEILIESTNQRLKDIVEDSNCLNDDHKKLQRFYNSGMNESRLNKEGILPLINHFNLINQIKNLSELSQVIAIMLSNQLATPFYLSVHADAKNSDLNILYLYQGGLGLPDRDFYFLPNKENEREGYQNFLKEIYLLADLTDLSQEIYKLEESLADISLTKTQRREPELVYNEFSVKTLKESFPNIDWHIIFKELNISPEKIVIDNPKFFQTLDQMISTTDLNIMKHYLKSNLLRSAAPYINDEFYQIYFDFYLKMLKGQEKQKERWKRTLNTVESSMGEILGKIYTDKYFPESAKNRAMEMVNNLKDELRNRIKNLDWMSEITKEKALEKLDRFRVKIGYPNKWKNFSKLEIGDCYLTNIFNAGKFDMEYDLSHLNKPVDREKWEMHAHQINAYYHPLLNEIVFPAGILQSPFFDHNADDALNYGGIGAVIGHEMTHGFDDKGRKFDCNGNLNDWWLEEDVDRYALKSKKISDQFSNYIIEGQNVNGELTLGENIADLGGVTIAFHAMIKNQKECTEKIDGFSQEQRFFLSWANVWRANIRKQESLNRLVTDPHSPSVLRINGVVTNLEEFYKAFNVTNDNDLYREDKASVW
ncbi:Peptidase family M13 [seawater metagenome]|uniref:Peptidase family M13 n=1 Tax=seawater metagenome TaxID=1561972 RepID=A0A5E8CJ12_9ZZZZ